MRDAFSDWGGSPTLRLRLAPSTLANCFRVYPSSFLLTCLFPLTDALLGEFRYLLGSGGTLLFDITIVIQSIIYRGRSPVRKGGKRRRTATIPREEEALLGGEGLLEEENVLVEGEEQQEFAWPSYGAAGADAHVGAGVAEETETAEPARPVT